VDVEVLGRSGKDEDGRSHEGSARIGADLAIDCRAMTVTPFGTPPDESSVDVRKRRTVRVLPDGKLQREPPRFLDFPGRFQDHHGRQLVLFGTWDQPRALFKGARDAEVQTLTVEKAEPQQRRLEVTFPGASGRSVLTLNDAFNSLNATALNGGTHFFRRMDR
jgi:hypothetical protein